MMVAGKPGSLASKLRVYAGIGNSFLPGTANCARSFLTDAPRLFLTLGDIFKRKKCEDYTEDKNDNKPTATA
jgi:hypothetical protein